MSKVCQISGKKVQFGNNVSKAINKTRRRFDANIISKKFYIPEEDKWVHKESAGQEDRTTPGSREDIRGN